MAIVVVCPNCLTSFQVKDKYAGKQGPCPRCRSIITIPLAAEEVVIREDASAVDDKKSKRRPVFTPIERAATKFHPLLTTGIIAAVVIAFAVAFGLRHSELKSNPFFLAMGAIILAPPLVLSGYAILRNPDLEPYRGQPLLRRAAICALVYVILWGVIWTLKYLLIGDADSAGPWQYFYLLAPPILLGATTALATLDLDFGSGAFHYSLYLATCALLRLAMNLPPV